MNSSLVCGLPVGGLFVMLLVFRGGPCHAASSEDVGVNGKRFCLSM